MSIKRTKQRNYGGRDKDEETSAFGGKPAEKEVSWAEAIADKSDGDFAAYALTAHYSKGALIVHSKFGKGVVTDVEGPRVTVLFEDGAKKLGHSS